MKWLLLLSLILFSFHISIGQVNDSGVREIKKTIVVTLDHQGNYFINSKKVDSTFFDSSLVRELRKLNSVLRRDSAIVVINADSSVNFGKVFHVMQLAKRSRARVVYNMRLD
jgi:biopolymer transport protein ExbD